VTACLRDLVRHFQTDSTETIAFCFGFPKKTCRQLSQLSRWRGYVSNSILKQQCCKREQAAYLGGNKIGGMASIILNCKNNSAILQIAISYAVRTVGLMEGKKSKLIQSNSHKNVQLSWSRYFSGLQLSWFRGAAVLQLSGSRGLGCPFIRDIFFIRIMNNFGLLFEYSNNIRIFILLHKLPILAQNFKKIQIGFK
jgi:hypothetical protein